MNDPFAGYAPLVGIVIVVIVLALRIRRLSQGRPLKLEWLWVMPAVLLAVTVASVVAKPPAALDWVWLAVVLALGGALGWYRGRMMTISVDPDTHALSARASPAAVILIVGIIAIRLGLRYVATEEQQAWHLNAVLITDGFVVFALGLFGVQRLEMWLRARRMLAEARAAKAAQATA
jgi:hypothetical protein